MYKQLQMANTLDCKDADFTLYNSASLTNGSSRDAVLRSGSVRAVRATVVIGRAWRELELFIPCWQHRCAGCWNSNAIHREFIILRYHEGSGGPVFWNGNGLDVKSSHQCPNIEVSKFLPGQVGLPCFDGLHPLPPLQNKHEASGTVIQSCKQTSLNKQKHQLQCSADATKSRTIFKRRQKSDMMESNEGENAAHVDDISDVEISINSTTKNVVAMDTHGSTDLDSEDKLPCCKKARLDPGLAANVLLQFATSAAMSPDPGEEACQHNANLPNMQTNNVKRVERVIALPHEPSQVNFLSSAWIR